MQLPWVTLGIISHARRNQKRNTCTPAKPLFILLKLSASLFSLSHSLSLSFHRSRFEEFESKNIPLPNCASPLETIPVDSRGNTQLWKNYFDPRLGLLLSAASLFLASLPSLPLRQGMDCTSNFTVSEREGGSSTRSSELPPEGSKRRLPSFPAKSDLVNRSSSVAMVLPFRRFVLQLGAKPKGGLETNKRPCKFHRAQKNKYDV